ncbi:MAG: twin-arginine translocation signal domain-containing protein, partial [Deferribacteraceae bacterium]|nr:twin-arginine translocation signal domain-containing protein [Deferribacteraceae bacterium]
MKSVFPISRRDLLKSTGTIVAAATLAGCGSNGSDDGEVLSSGSDRLAMDPEVKIYHTTGAYNCGSRCQQKVHVKNGRIVAFTSAGDRKIRTPAEKDEADRKAEYDSSELGKPMELRACVRCYGGYQGLLYQPDKLKYPLIRDDTSKPKGDLSNFRRATWEEATDLVVEKIAAAIERSATDNLKYVPIMSRYFMWLTMARAYGVMPKPFLNMNGNESFGGVDQGTFDTVGLAAYINSRSDRYNTKFMITWALDVTRTTYWQAHTHFMNSRIKEGTYGTIPMVVISSTYSDAAAMLSTGVPDYTYTVNGASKTVDIPRFIACRPATDSCLAVAMIYVIYKNNRWSASYMDRSSPANRKCFGFFAGDTVVSQAPTGTGKAGRPIVNPVNLTGTEPFYTGSYLPAESELTGITFNVPAGESCEEYLKGLEVAWAGAAVDGGTSSYKYPQPS